MSRMVVTREIYSPVERTFAYHTDLERTPDYWPSMRDCSKVGGLAGPAQEGDRYRWTYRSRWHDTHGELRVLSVVPGQSFVFETTGDIRARFDCTYTPTARTRSRVTVRVDFTFQHGIVGRVLDRLLVERATIDDVERAMEDLKERLEVEMDGLVNASLAAAVSRPEGWRPAFDIEILDARGETLLDRCAGPDASGRCSRGVAEGEAVPCAGRLVALGPPSVEPAWRLLVAPSAVSCPFACLVPRHHAVLAGDRAAGGSVEEGAVRR